MVRKTIPLLPALALLFSVSCADSGAEFHPLDGRGNFVAGNTKDERDVAVYITKKPDFPYEELGIISFETLPSQSDEPSVYRKFRAKAASVGADGVIIMNSQNSVEQIPVFNYDIWGAIVENTVTRSVVRHRAMAIRKTAK